MRRAKRRDPLSVALRVLVWAAAAVATGVVLFVFILLINVSFSLLKRRMD